MEGCAPFAGCISKSGQTMLGTGIRMQAIERTFRPSGIFGCLLLLIVKIYCQLIKFFREEVCCLFCDISKQMRPGKTDKVIENRGVSKPHVVLRVL